MSNAHAIVVHGGAGTSRENEDGCTLAAGLALAALRRGGDALDAAVAAVVSMEDDGRFNAGTGSVLCLDGQTIEMDAAVMDTRSRLGGVACITQVKNPVLVARAVADSPHWLLAGDGATRFARAGGHPPFRQPTDKARAAHARLLASLGERPAFARLWNYERPLDQAAESACDTVGAVVRGADGHFAVASSTGGAAPSLLGRVGDTPIIGSGFYAGPEGAVAATGFGEQIVRHLLAFTVYQWIAAGTPLEQALQRGIGLFDPAVAVGLIAVSQTDQAACSNRAMPRAIIQDLA
ncbi:isoaspartyl peptidase/L-asparaginase [Massilia pseudoviolaceinigra]|uniref:isoaspartyl peptidase/L-asparaginase n=1 Tax=Massilia pseudoviolaceinigra TaxID=3057165 RepID=UPI00279654CF|nr:isoaspartyl peptidase/L-asparaginase [Massilia sp. CCM 9206]MDQ1923078.1 isoaspartyl peptidase/L-asparaginase [Massilia sp. CCM 9206]